MDAPRHPDSPVSPRARSTRVALHLAGLVAAGVIAWLLWMGYRQPGLVFELANMSLC